ncbi:hypothetical protein PSEUBRA_004861 [Kalmanozyma brasiliensis GHG001]|uniref:uncharacterized protein n=1 Tax=Kalmanozyma brasiliensis (strain GHG001) TaxID=1365824 RepID=UPI002867FB0F|nr:uncharacterized protein PSEUBRA_004861 [Kalmanozyma brasiliensis GHG001]KAF6767443.1 hypothetical protein PSEUBRA_004861 [Kalmanozyma brasiliensis GHG001]
MNGDIHPLPAWTSRHHFLPPIALPSSKASPLTMQVQYLEPPRPLSRNPSSKRQNPVSRTTSNASSYRTANDTFSDALDTVDSASASNSTSPPTSIDSQYEVIHSARHGKALVIEQPTLVNFVPTSEIQTAVRVTADRVVIDTILPPTAVLRASNVVRRPAGSHVTEQVAKDFDATELLKKHEEELIAMLSEKLTANYDPTGTIKGEILTTLTQVTRFPDPKGIDGKNKKGVCPCICCEMGCEAPLEPWNEVTGEEAAKLQPKEAEASTSQPVAEAVRTETPQPQPTATPVEPTKEVPASTGANTTDAKPSKERRTWLVSLHRNKDRKQKDDVAKGKDKPDHYGFMDRFHLPNFARFSRSRTDNNLVAHYNEPKVLPVAASVPQKATSEAVPQAGSITKKASFSKLARRRRDRHARSSIEVHPNSPAKFQADLLKRRAAAPKPAPAIVEPLPRSKSLKSRRSFSTLGERRDGPARRSLDVNVHHNNPAAFQADLLKGSAPPPLPSTAPREAPLTSKSMTSLASRRRDKHARSSLDLVEHRNNPNAFQAELLRRPTRASLDTSRLPSGAFQVDTYPCSVRPTAPPRQSLDSVRPPLEDHNLPLLPARRSSKVFSHPLTPPSNVTSVLRETVGRNGLGEFGRIVEEDEARAREEEELEHMQVEIMSVYAGSVSGRGRRMRDEVGLAF